MSPVIEVLSSQSRPVDRAYHPSQLAVVIPTKDRPAQIDALLANFCRQTVEGFRVVVVDGSTSAAPVVRRYADRLLLTYLASPVPGQIRQRNLGLAHLDAGDRLVGFIDDDMILDPWAFERLLAFWNRVPRQTAGIGLNLSNTAAYSGSMVRRLLLLDHPRRGRVLPSGANTGIGALTSSIRTQWLGGGYTIWRREILEDNPYPPLDSRWAVGEDLRYSYPIGKRFPLWVCAEARAVHRHVSRPSDLVRFGRYRGRKIVAASLYFVRCHHELSVGACYWMLLGLCLSRLVAGRSQGQRHMALEGLGMAEGLRDCLAAGTDRAYLYSQMEN